MMRRLVLLLALGVVALPLACCGLMALLYPSTNTYLVTYRVGGDAADVELRYAGALGPFDRADVVRETARTPWEATVRRDMLFARRSATMSIEGPPGATLTCEILVNGVSAERVTGVGRLSCGYDEERNPVP